jgi:hypothetical protein
MLRNKFIWIPVALDHPKFIVWSDLSANIALPINRTIRVLPDDFVHLYYCVPIVKEERILSKYMAGH